MDGIKTYTELSKIKTFEGRFNYLKLNSIVGKETFGFDRYLNQVFYQRSRDWKNVRDYVIVRDNGCDLGIEGREIHNRILVHHMNPVTEEDLLYNTDNLLDPEFLIATTHLTHNAIHYGDEHLLMILPKEREMYDTCPWKKEV